CWCTSLRQSSWPGLKRRTRSATGSFDPCAKGGRSPSGKPSESSKLIPTSRSIAPLPSHESPRDLRSFAEISPYFQEISAELGESSLTSISAADGLAGSLLASLPGAIARICPSRGMVERAGFEPAYACAGRFTVCCL